MNERVQKRAAGARRKPGAVPMRQAGVMPAQAPPPRPPRGGEGVAPVGGMAAPVMTGGRYPGVGRYQFDMGGGKSGTV